MRAPLTAIIEQSLALDPFAATVYGFTNRRRDRIKLIFWDRNGFWMLLKRL
ncbi:IS66 family insertion sequence element accessory protein TnpB, partial [Paraburkholderia aspalathi]|uniref:IS66 family insertion sequence element accessory protein TnpB n=1 Tax=Paraburkholderia aspalathi TaxID=1324617 RepID=UPI0038B9968B